MSKARAPGSESPREVSATVTLMVAFHGLCDSAADGDEVQIEFPPRRQVMSRTYAT
jgi:hypothetical protein